MPVDPSGAASPSVRLVLRTLGGAALHVQRANEQPGQLLTGGKWFALLTYLALSPSRSADRARLVDLLWSDARGDDARNPLRVALSNIRARYPGVLGTSVDPVVLAAPVDADYHALVAAHERGDAATVVELFAGDFLPGFALPGADAFEEWADAERTRVRSMFVRAAGLTVREQLSAGHFREAEALARRVRDLELARDVGWRLLLECLIARQDALGLVVELAALDRLLADNALRLEPPTRALAAQARALVDRSADGPGAREADSAAPLVSELVGREHEFSTIMRAWTAAGEGRVVRAHLVAPAGLGKTRLLADVHTRLRAARARVVHVAGTYGTRDIAYGLASDLVGALGSRRGARGVSREAAGALVALTPALSTLFEVAPDSATGEEALRRRALAVRELLAVLTEEQPLAVLVDDLHWSDSLTRRLLAMALSGLGEAPLLVLSAGRDTPDELASLLGPATIPLAPLTVEATARLLASIAVLPDQPGVGQLPAALHRATLGSPLLVLETLALLREQHLLAVSADHWVMVDPDRLAAALRAGSALRHRLERLLPEERRALLLLAAAGVPLTTRRLAAAWGAIVEGGEPVHELDAALAALEQRGIVVFRADAWGTAHDEHAAALLDAAADGEVRAAAAAVGHVLARDVGDDPRQHQLAARLLTRGGDRAGLQALFARVVRQRRLEGDGRSDRALAEELLGTGTAGAVGPALVRGLPWHVRARLVSPRRITAVIATATLVPVSVAVAGRLLSRPRPAVEAVLEVERPSADHATLDLFAVPLDALTLASPTPLDVDVSGRPDWRLPDSIMRYRQAGWAPRPDRRGWAMARAVRDSGVLDLFDLRLDGTARRLTFARSDDLEPDWSPDNTLTVFATMRWAAHGAYSLAVRDARTGRVRRLTDPGVDGDQGPLWSPEGSRIAFERQRSGPAGRTLCVVDSDGTHERCFRNAAVGAPLGWADARHLFVSTAGPTGPRLLRFDVEGGQASLVHADAGGASYVPSPDGRYVLCECRRRGYPAGSTFLFAVDLPNELKPIRVVPAGTPPLVVGWAPTSPRRPFLDTLHVALGPGPPVLGTPYQLRAAGVDSAGLPVEVGVVRWRSLDTALAVIDSTGLLRARRTGRVTVEASAGGWRTARAAISIGTPADRLLLDERWARGLAANWRRFGVPQPLVVPSATFGPAFTQNGDGSFWSGAYTAGAFPVAGGLWVEIPVALPFTDSTASQEQMVQLFAYPGSVRWATWDHATGDYPGAYGCRFDYPRAFASLVRADSMAAFTPTESRGFGVPRRVRDGQPFRALVQIFPDGRCGFAFDGVPFWVSAPAYLRPDARLMLFGNSQRTRVLVGPLQLHAGIAPHVPWDQLRVAVVPEPP